MNQTANAFILDSPPTVIQAIPSNTGETIMSDNIMQSQDTSVELSEQDLEAVAGGVSLALGSASGLAFGTNFAATATETNTTAISAPGFNLAASDSSSASIAG
jgi:hypothetical protein